jgi:transcriptional regulator with XRE-family HTH domain
VDIIKVFADNVKNYRKSLGLSQEELASRSGLHRTYISQVERYQRSISLENIQRLADSLNVETYKLFLVSEDKSNSYGDLHE